MTRPTLRAIVAFGAILSGNPLAQAQQPPDAGSILRDQPKPAARPAVPVAPIQVDKPAPPAPDAGPRIVVKGFRFEGATLFPADVLAAQVKEAIGVERSFPELQTLALALVGFYAQNGYLARVTLPPQDVKDGIVTFRVIEGRRGGLQINRTGERLDAERIQGFIDRRLGRGDLMSLARLGEGLSVLNEQPGISARSALIPGKVEGEIDLVVDALAQPLLSYSVSGNNHGSRATGRGQVSGSATLNNPTGRFDSVSVLVNTSDGTSFGRVDYSLAVGNSGLRLGANASRLHYRLVQENFAALQSSGTAETVGFNGSFPLVRGSGLNLSLTGSLDKKWLFDETVAGETSNREVTVGNLGLNGSSPDTLFGGGLNAFGLGVSLGDVDQRNAGARAGDDVSRRVQGKFHKLAWNYGRIHPLSDTLSLNATLRGQFASKNLDSSERFVLGGPAGVRAFPVGEAAGDEGWLLSVNLTHQIGEKLSASAFVDHGGIKVNRNPSAVLAAANPLLPNRYELSGVGVGMAWQPWSQLSVNASVAVPMGGNAGRDANGNNADGTRIKPRAWVGLTAQF